MSPLPLLALLFLCLLAPRAAAAAVDPTPTPWPHQFHAGLIMEYRGRTALVNLWYDWPRGRSLHDIRSHLTSDEPYYDVQWNNGTSFLYNPASRACRSVEVGVGIFRPDWLATGAAYLGRAPATASAYALDCHVWSKADFVTYYEDVRTGYPVKWVFYTGHTADVISFDPGAVEDAEWQAPAYCFAKENDSTANNTLTSEPDGNDDGSFISMIRMPREINQPISWNPES